MATMKDITVSVTLCPNCYGVKSVLTVQGGIEGFRSHNMTGPYKINNANTKNTYKES